MKKHAGLLIFTVFLFLTTRLNASDHTVELDPITVTATRVKKSIRDVSATMDILTKKDIESSVSRSCTDALNTAPGLFVHKTGDYGRADLDVRGIGNRGTSVMVLINGRPVKMGIFGCTVTHTLPLDHVERIEVLRGPASVIYGSDAMAGAVNILTRQPVQTQETELTSSVGTHNSQNYKIFHGGGSNKIRYRLAHDKNLSNGHVDNSAYNAHNTSAEINYRLSKTKELSASFKNFNGFKQEPIPSPPGTWNDYNRSAADITFEQSSASGFILGKVYSNFGEHIFSNKWHSKDQSNGALLNSTIRTWPGNELITGFEYKKQYGRSLGTNPGQWDKAEHAVFIHDEQKITDKFIATLGVRYHHDQISKEKTVTQAGLVFKPVNTTAIRLNRNQGFRSPPISDLYLYPSSNKQLTPETTTGYELGINHRINMKAVIDMSAFTIKGTNIVELVRQSAPPPLFIKKNTGQFTFKGLEAKVHIQWRKNLSSKLSYSVMDTGSKTTGRPGRKTDGSLAYQAGKTKTFLSAQHVSDYHASDHHTQKIKNYFLGHAKFLVQATPEITLFASIKNMADVNYKIYADLPGGSAGLYQMPGRTFTSGLTYKF